VVPDKPADPTKAAFGARVVVRRSNGDEDDYRIVGVLESDPEQGSISWASPLARALLGRKAGDKVWFRSPGGDEEFTIISVAWTVGPTHEGTV
jgi:transcription elongation factor GreB